MKRSIGWLVAAAAAALAGGLAGAMTAAHIRSTAGGLVSGICSVDATLLGVPFDCDAVNSSTFASLFGIPLAILGVGCYAVLLGLAVLAWRRREQGFNPAAHLLVAVAGVTVFYSVLLTLVQLFYIGAICPLCVLLYSFQLIIFVAGLWALRWQVFEAARVVFGMVGRAHQEPLIWSSALGFLLIVGSLQLVSGAAGAVSSPEVAAVQSRLARAARVDVAAEAGDATAGPADADYLVIEFSDFMCPFCQRAATDASILKEELPDRVRLVFKHYPLDTACNPHLSRNMHPGACDAAAAAICAQDAGRFWPFHDALFAKQKRLFRGDVRDNLLLEAEKLGLSRDSFAACMDDPDTRARLQRDIETARRIGVRGTPAFVVNGRSFFTDPVALGAGSVRVARIAIDNELLLD